MSSQDTEGDEEVSAFFRNVQEIRAEELLPTEVMDKLKKLEDSVENLKKLEHSMGLIFQQLSKLLYCSCGLFLLFLFFIFFVAFFFFGLFCFVIVIFAFCFVPTLFIDFLKLTNILHVSFFPNVNNFFYSI
ncbi:uncharacterized protein LOC124807541 isoform X1 [Hydra vulgaris]|uniref:uncharacterized protein LOC124807541 isoform X1 n=1 Tax=Hydra vulgaris TaxID=6087 RepID=UPI0032EA3BA2